MPTQRPRRRIAVLGELTVAVDGHHRPITAPKQRAVLAHLALEPGLALSADRLLTSIWGDDQPAGGAKAVAFQITKLRDALEPERDGEGSMIRTTPGGYLLDIDAGQVDVHAAVALVDDAAHALDHDATKAAELAEDAMALFRGEPFADVPPSPVLDDERRRLDLLRLRAESLLIEARLASGEHAAVLPDVARLADRHPLDERIALLHIRALDRCGRTADALRAHAGLRERLVDELGIDPSHELQALELALLDRDTGRPSRPGASPTTSGTPVPTPATSLIGRDDETEAIARQLADGQCRVLTLLGPGGVGKTRLAVAAAKRWVDEHSAPAWYCPLAGVDAGSPVVEVVAEAVGFAIDGHAVAAAGLDDRTQLLDYLSLQSGLLVIDNAEHLERVPQLVADIAEQCPELTVLVTSRERLAVAAEWVRPIDGLDISGRDCPAAALFLTRARQAGADVGSDDHADVDRVCRATEGLPLALELGAAMAPTMPLVEIADRLETAALSIESDAVDADPRHTSLSAAFEGSWALLDEPLRAALSRLSVFPAPFDADAARHVAGAGPSTLARLMMRSLVRRVDRTRLDLHPLIRQFAATRLDDSSATRLAHAAFYLDRMSARTRDLLGSPDQMDVVVDTDAEIEHVRAASVWMAQHADDGAADDRLTGAVHALSAYGFVRSVVSWSESLTAIADRIEAALGPDVALGSDTYLWARAYHSYPDAMLEGKGVLELMERLETPLGFLHPKALAWCLMNQAICHDAAGDVERALVLMERAAQVGCEDDPLLYAAITSWHGWELSLLGRHDEADAVWQRGLEHATRSRNETARAYLLSKVGLAADDMGNHQLALHCHEQSTEIFERTGDNGGLGYTLSRISWTQRMLGNTDAAIEAAEAGLERFRRVNHRWGIGASLGRRAHANLDGGRLDDAASDFAECITWGEQKQLPSIVCYGLIGIALALVHTGEYEAAVELCAHNTTVEQNPYAPVFAVPTLADLEGNLAADVFASARRRGEQMSLEQAKALALGRARRLSGS